MKSVLIASSLLVVVVASAGCASSDGASNEGAAGNGAAGNSNGSAGSNSVSMPGYPSGAVVRCFGAGCPLGECDNTQFFSSTACSDLYPSNLAASFSYCKVGGDTGYCLETESELMPVFAINCAAGSQTVLSCASSGCIIDAGRAMCTN